MNLYCDSTIRKLFKCGIFRPAKPPSNEKVSGFLLKKERKNKKFEVQRFTINEIVSLKNLILQKNDYLCHPLTKIFT